MPVEQFLNNAADTLYGAINNSVTTITVCSGNGFPSQNFRLIIEDEIMYCTSRTGNTLTVIRGVEGTTAESHDDGTDVEHIITAGSMNQLLITALADINKVPDDESLSADDDNFDDENFSGWTKVANSTPLVVETEKSHTLSLNHPGGGNSAQFISYMKNKTPTVGDWMQCGFSIYGTGSNYAFVGLIFADGSTYGSGNQLMCSWDVNEQLFVLHQFTGYNSNGSALTIPAFNSPISGVIHMKAVWEGTNTYSYYVSSDALSWNTIWNGQSYGSLGTPSWMGFGVSTWGGGPRIFSFHYMRFSF